MAAPLINNYGSIGTAFDYLVRFYLEKIIEKITTNNWFADYGVGLLNTLIIDYPTEEMAKMIIIG